jgi:serine/threonine protein phosphatase 1
MNDKTEAPHGGTRLYVIGDIHGRSDLLDGMIEEIHRDFEAGGECSGLTVTLGDYVDRGPDSRGVLDRLARNPFPTKYVALKGNHESLFEAFLRDPSTCARWRKMGGLETLHSYRVPVGELMVGKGFDQAAAALNKAVPDHHLRFITSLKLSLTAGNHFLCHAGVRPGVPLDRQNEEDLLWIRNEFLNSSTNFGKVVIHGHSPTEWPDVRHNRINIDTGAFATGRLTCVVIEGDRQRFLFAA